MIHNQDIQLKRTTKKIAQMFDPPVDKKSSKNFVRLRCAEEVELGDKKE